MSRTWCATSPLSSAAVATWYRSGWNVWKLLRSISSTSTGAWRKPLAAWRPPKPAPTMITRGRVVMGEPPSRGDAPGVKPRRGGTNVPREKEYMLGPVRMVACERMRKRSGSADAPRDARQRVLGDAPMVEGADAQVEHLPSVA